MAGTRVDIALVTIYLDLFNTSDGMFKIESIIPGFQRDRDHLTDEQMTALEQFEDATVQLHWVLDALRQCNNEFGKYVRMDRKRKEREEEDLDDGAGTSFVHLLGLCTSLTGDEKVHLLRRLQDSQSLSAKY